MAPAAVTTIPADHYDMAAAELKTLRRAYERTTNWLADCAAYSARLAAGVEDATPPNVRSMPSKDHKHRMYASAERVHRLLDMPGDRPHTLHLIGHLIVDADTFLRSR